jgi:hypothetical protein
MFPGFHFNQTTPFALRVSATVSTPAKILFEFFYGSPGRTLLQAFGVTVWANQVIHGELRFFLANYLILTGEKINPKFS